MLLIWKHARSVHQLVLKLWNFSRKLFTQKLSEDVPELFGPSWKGPSSLWTRQTGAWARTGSWRFCTSWRGRDPRSTELHLQSPPCGLSDCCLQPSVWALRSSEELLYFWEQPTHLVLQSRCGTVQTQVGLSVYMERSSCTSGHRKASDRGLCGDVTVLWELAVELGVRTGLEGRTSCSQALKANLSLGLPTHNHKTAGLD